jgi:hypothetical protein
MQLAGSAKKLLDYLDLSRAKRAQDGKRNSRESAEKKLPGAPQ